MEVEKQRQLFVLFITAVIVIIVISVLLLINVWSDDEEQIEESYEEIELGKISNSSVSVEDYIQKYFTQIQIMLFEKNYSKFFSYLGQDYIEYAEMTEEKLETYLIDKKIVGERLALTSYETIYVDGFSNIYILNMKLETGIYDLNIIIREVSPNDYTIALDNYIKSENGNYNSTLNGINFEIKQKTYFNNYIEYDIAIKNVHDKEVKLNSKKLSEGVYLKLNDSSLIQPYATVLGGRDVQIDSGRLKEYKIRYYVGNNNFKFINSIVLKDVYYVGVEAAFDVEFVL